MELELAAKVNALPTSGEQGTAWKEAGREVEAFAKLVR